jgi:ParB family chromosome partitioning protein
MSNQIQISEFTKDMLGNKDVIRQNTTRGEEVVKIALDKILVRSDFNVRKDYGDIESLANSILENGQTIAGRVDALADGTFVLTDGHRRFTAMKLLEEKGHEVFFKAIVNGSRTTEEQRILQMFTTQDNKPLLPVEIAELIQRMINLGHDVKGVAKKIGKSTTYVSQMLSLSEESVEVKELINQKKITTSAVLKVKADVHSHKERTEKIKEAVAKNNGNRVTDEQITNKKANKATELANQIANHYGFDTEQVEVIFNIIRKYY